LVPKPRPIGVGYRDVVIPTIHPAPHDIPMDVIVIESGFVKPIASVSRNLRRCPDSLHSGNELAQMTCERQQKYARVSHSSLAERFDMLVAQTKRRKTFLSRQMLKLTTEPRQLNRGHRASPGDRAKPIVKLRRTCHSCLRERCGRHQIEQ